MTKQTITIYFFSGTGNSLFAAKELAKKLNAKLLPISTVTNRGAIQPETDIVGLVFPVYYASNDEGGIPLIVSRSIKKLVNIQSKYFFAVCTHGGTPGTTVENVKKALTMRSGELAAGFTLKMSNHALSSEKQQKEMAAQQEKLDAIAQYITAKKTGKYETRSKLSKLALSPALYFFIKPIFSRRFRMLSGTKQRASFLELVPSADSSFEVSQNCNGCGLCARVCPVNNIQIIEGKPVWLHHCETCFACYSWCPQKAIGGQTAKYNTHYHHSQIKLAEVLEKTEA